MHAPHGDAEEVALWWKDTREILARFTRDAVPLIVMMDTNMHVRPMHGTLCGDRGAGNQSKHGAQMTSFQSVFDLLNITSHSRLLKRDVPILTYKSTQGSWSQNDYLFTSQSVVVEANSCEVVLEFDNMTEAEDHLPVVVNITLPTKQCKTVQRYKHCNYDRNGWRDLAKAEVFRDLTNKAPYGPLLR